jgi:ribonuclease-3
MTNVNISDRRRQELAELLSKLDIPMTRIELLQEALTHSSYRSDHPGTLDYERLEFFGDAVLKFVVSEYLFERFASYPEGQLTEIRAVLVSDRSLAEMAQALDLGRYVLIGRRGSLKPSIVACAMEAIFGAIYLDSGLPHVQNLIVRYLGAKASEIHENASSENYKAQLQHLSQAHARGTPVYTLVERQGPAHDPIFIVNVAVAEQVLAEGTGRSKKEAEQAAAKAALIKLNGEMN